MHHGRQDDVFLAPLSPAMFMIKAGVVLAMFLLLAVRNVIAGILRYTGF